jgi:hypothetical protein
VTGAVRCEVEEEVRMGASESAPSQHGVRRCGTLQRADRRAVAQTSGTFRIWKSRATSEQRGVET